MKLPKKRSSPHKVAFITLLAILLSVAAVATAMYYLNAPPTVSQTSSKESQKEEKQQKAQSNSQKESFLDNEKNSETEAKPAEVPDSSSSISLTAKQAGSVVVTTVKLDGQGYSSGACELTTKYNGKINSQDAEIVYQPEYSTCSGFSTPVSVLGPGKWDITLTVTPLNGKAISKTATVTVE